MTDVTDPEAHAPLPDPDGPSGTTDTAPAGVVTEPPPVAPGVEQDATIAGTDPSSVPPASSFIDEPVGAWREREPLRDSAAAVFESFPWEKVVTALIVGGLMAFVFYVLDPVKILTNTTPAGGDMGAHVWAPAYLRDHLLMKGRLSGWTPDWYAGFPAFQFYMIIPSLMIALLSFIIPYGIAFKLVAVSGVVTLPFSCYFFGRMARLPFPAPPLLAVGATLFLFDRSFSIYGGNIPSTLAGEFAFSISLSFAFLYLGVLARGLENGKHRGWMAILLALTGLCHLIPLIFVAVCTVIWFAIRPGIGQLKYLLTAAPVGILLTLFWTLPFVAQRGYMNDMGWEKIERYSDYLWDRSKLDPQLVNSPNLQYVIAFAAVGLLLSLVYRRRAGLFLAVVAVVFAIAFVKLPNGALWNARLLPFYYLALYLLAAVGIAELGRLLSALFARDVNRPIRSLAIVTPILGFFAAYVLLSMTLQIMPGGKVDAEGSYSWLMLSTKDRSFVDSWADWNFDGYEGTATLPSGQVQYKKSYPEYYGIVTTMANLGKDPKNGCGRAMWEHEEQHDRYGTPMALMLLPFWTDGCIGSMEGLYFEASTTTPYHFINQDELSWGPSNAQRDLPYGPGPPTQADFDLGISHLQMMGVKYYMAINDNTKALAKVNTSLTSVATSGPWTVYTVADAPLVEALKNQPAVLTGQLTTGRQWQDTAVCWYENKDAWDVYLTADGPGDWQRVADTVPSADKATPAAQCEPKGWGWFDANGGPEVKAQKAATVTNITSGDDSISFDVSEPGVPVLVKASYFPNWQVTGADHIYRSVPNFMIVVPTANHVELHFGRAGVDYLAWFLTFVGIAGVVLLFRFKPVEIHPPWRFWGRSERPDLFPAGPDLRYAHSPAFDQQTANALAGIVPLGAPPGYPTGPPLFDPGIDRDAGAALATRDRSDALGRPLAGELDEQRAAFARPIETVDAVGAVGAVEAADAATDGAPASTASPEPAAPVNDLTPLEILMATDRPPSVDAPVDVDDPGAGRADEAGDDPPAAHENDDV